MLLVIFEARPEAAVQIFGLAVLTGNAVILKGGKEATETLKEITAAIRAAIEAAGPGVPPALTVALTRALVDWRMCSSAWSLMRWSRVTG